jgi:hypothetical protein
MSIEEQDQIYGRLSRQHAESWRAAGALGAKLQSFREALANAVTNLNDRDLLGPGGLGPQGTIANALRATQEIPDRQVVLDTLRELQVELERLREFRTQLDRLKTTP